jgi:osmoprotectant transport system substrate-binding protein
VTRITQPQDPEQSRPGHAVRAALDAASSRLTTVGLVQLNRSVEVDGLTPAAAAARWWNAQ